MIKKTLSNISLYLCFFLIYIALAFHIGNPLIIKTFNSTLLSYHNYLQLSVQDVAKLYKETDSGIYAATALTLLQTGHYVVWVANTWPPGQVAIIAAILKLSGGNDYPLKMLLLATALWALGFVLVYRSLDRPKNPLFKMLLAISPLYFSFFQNWIFSDGIIMSENLCLPLFIISLSLFVFWLKENRIKYLIASAVALAFLAYLRGYFESFGTFLSRLALLYIAANIIKEIIVCKIRETQAYNFRKIFSENLKAIIIALLVFNAILVPWKVHNYINYHSFRWINMQIVWNGSWEMTPPPHEWIPAGDTTDTSTVACDVQHQLCQLIDSDKNNLSPELYRNLAIVTWLSGSFQWYKIKAQNFNIFWFGLSWQDLLHQHRLFFIEGAAIFFAGILAIIVGLKYTKSRGLRERKLYQLSLLFILFNFLLFSFFSYQPRYSLFLHLLFIYVPIWLFFGFNRLRTATEQIES